MLKRKSRKKVMEEIEKGMLENVFNIIPNLSDKVMDYAQKQFDIINLLQTTFKEKRIYHSDISTELILLSGIQSRMKQQFSISELSLALTSKKIINQLEYNLSYQKEESLLKEANLRAFLSKYQKEESDNFDTYFIQYYNIWISKLLEKAQLKCHVHILDCSILDVPLENSHYEGSTVTSKGGETLRGYKIGALRGITPNAGIIEEITMETAKTNDLTMTKEMILNSSYLKPGDYLLEDRGFLDIGMMSELNTKGVSVILPVKKNMEIYLQAVKEAKEKNKWKKHPNSKRKGQDICLVTSLEDCWLSEKNRLKKPKNLKLTYKLNACVIRIDKEKNKEVLTDKERLTMDEKYAYAVLVTNDISISCEEITRMYEQRPEIEEDFRQLKDFWGLNTYKSTQYHIISFVIFLSLAGYSLYQLYMESEEGQKYIGKSLIVEEKHGLYIVKGVRTAIVTTHYFEMFEQAELLDLYVSIKKDKREMLKEYLSV